MPKITRACVFCVVISFAFAIGAVGAQTAGRIDVAAAVVTKNKKGKAVPAPNPQLVLPPATQDAIDRIAKALETSKSNLDNSNDREADDLAAQRMADAAEGLESISWIQVYLGAAGLVLLTLTTAFACFAWLAARRGARAAQKVLPHSQLAAEAAMKAATAAETSADAVIGLEVARLILHKIETSFVESDLKVWLKSSDLEASFENHGRTTAIVTESCLVLRLADELDPTPTYPADSITQIAQPFVAESNGPFRFKRKLQLTDEDVNRIIEGKTLLWAYGYIRFQDFLNNAREVGFCRVLETLPHSVYPTMLHARGRFRGGGPSSYTYSRILNVGSGSSGRSNRAVRASG